jgi:subtilase family serine protease
VYPPAPPVQKAPLTFSQIYNSAYVSENEYGDPELPYDPYGLGTNVSGGYWGSGGGVSSLYAKPWYQYIVNTPALTHRYVPDISMQMGGCPAGISVTPCHGGDSFSIYTLDGGLYGFIGTSLSSPEFAGVLALKVGAGKSRLGNVNGYIYELAAAQAKLPPSYPGKFYHQGIGGYNGVVKVLAGTPGWTQLVGVGTPYTTNFIGESALPVAGIPLTYSNP